MWGMDSARNCAAHGHSPLVSIKLSQAAATTILRSAAALLPEQAQNHETTKSTLRLWISQAQTRDEGGFIAISLSRNIAWQWFCRGSAVAGWASLAPPAGVSPIFHLVRRHLRCRSRLTAF